ncbi:MAG TPA: AAA family ATPase, partial [Polyangiales bacterium]|nr:AAA family ATPase [Polyangiales bacterium]
MKLLRLELAAFGSLSGIQLDLATPEPCLHVIYGANEAGKSTALRALSGLFYGIPENTPDAHRFKPNDLRIGALLCDARGRELYVMRRKGRKHTLLGRDGEPLHGPDVSWISAGVSEAQFRSLFALGYDTLEEGADELLGSAGELGESLFTAGVGGAGAHTVLEALSREADALYRPRGRNQRLNEVLLAFEEAKRGVRESAIRAEAYSDQQRGIAEAEAEVARRQQARQQLIAER